MKKKTVTLEVVFDILDIELKVEYRKDDGLFMVYGNYVEVKDDCVLRSEYGLGKTPNLATRNYAKQLAGKLIVVDAMSSNRREIKVPDYIK